MWSNDRLAYRQCFYDAWQKGTMHQPLTPLEHQIFTAITWHPEYHFIFKDDRLKERNYFPELGEANPFLHLSLHLGLIEQLETNRPAGIREIYQALLNQKKDAHHVHHMMMERINHMMYSASRGELILDDALYLQHLQSLQ